MPFSVKRITHAFLQYEKKFIYNKQQDLRTLPLPFKRTCKQKILVQVTRKLHTAIEMKKKQATTLQIFISRSEGNPDGDEIRDPSCVLLQNPRNSNIFDTFCLKELVHNY